MVKMNFSVQDLDADEFLSGNYLDDILRAEKEEKEHDTSKKNSSRESREGQVNIDEDGEMSDDGGSDSDGCVVDGDDLEGRGSSGEEENSSSSSPLEEEEDEIASHGRELRDLSSIDPEFHKFLQSEEPELLRIGDPELQADEYDTKNGSTEKGEEYVKKKIEEEKDRQQQKVLSWKLFREFQQAAFIKKTLKGLKQLLAAFHSICAEEEDNDKNKVGRGKKQGGGRPAKFWVPDPDLRDALMRCCVSKSYKAFLWHLFPEEIKAAINSVNCDVGVDGDGGSTRSLNARKDEAVASLGLGLDKVKITKASTLPQYRALKPMIYGFLRALLRLAGNVTDRKLLCFIFQSLEHYVLFFVFFPGVSKAWLTFFLKAWSNLGNTDVEDGTALQLLSFFRIRDMSLRLPPPFLDECLRGVYLVYARVAINKFVSEQTRPALTFMGNGIVELYSIDVAAAYQNAFTYVRQLALVLRQGLIKGDPGSMAVLFQWQYIHCLRIWVAVVVAMPAQDELGIILYSLAQVIMGVATLANSLFLSPTRFHCVAMLHELAAAGNVYIPTWSLLLDIIDSPKLKKKNTPSTSPSPQLQNIVKIGDGVLTHQTVQTAVVSRAFELLDEAVSLYSHAAALPELSYILLPRLRRYMKHTQRPQWRKLAGDVIIKLESAALQVKNSRDEEFGAPSKFPGLVNSLPHRKQQHSIMVEKQQCVEKLLSSSSPAREVAETVVHRNIEQQDVPHLQGNRNVNKRRFKKAVTLQAELGCLGDEDADIVQDLKGIWSDNEE